MDEKKRKIEIEDKRAAATGDGSAAQESAPLLEPEQASADEAMSAEDSQVQQQMWQQKAAEYLDLAQRREAELRNALRRGESEREAAVSNALEGLIHDLFPALDALAQAAAHTDDEGIKSTLKLLKKGFSKHGIEVIGEAGEPFDGHLHQALQVEDGDVEQETVSQVYAEGYRIGDRVLKPALVKVTKPSTP